MYCGVGLPSADHHCKEFGICFALESTHSMVCHRGISTIPNAIAALLYGCGCNQDIGYSEPSGLAAKLLPL